eukprot:TRINITY_DN29185_c0_g1_i1.p1 TRINITY_DN29185_c0_g1~~TRINITY_DN29185_c0_g1_i1.p1  ORF type:complete len:122 (+),score=6.23 TRINITY_DN29185_c0_g1_i1:16-381(+)
MNVSAAGRKVPDHDPDPVIYIPNQLDRSRSQLLPCSSCAPILPPQASCNTRNTCCLSSTSLFNSSCVLARLSSLSLLDHPFLLRASIRLPISLASAHPVSSLNSSLKVLSLIHISEPTRPY